MAQIIIGLAVTAMCQLLATGTESNAAATELSTGVNLANNIHELAVGLPFNDPGHAVIGTYHSVWDINGLTFSPPIDAKQQSITGYANWAQTVTVQTVDNTQLTAIRPNNTSVPTALVSVVITHNNRSVYTASWLVVAADPS